MATSEKFKAPKSNGGISGGTGSEGKKRGPQSLQYTIRASDPSRPLFNRRHERVAQLLGHPEWVMTEGAGPNEQRRVKMPGDVLDAWAKLVETRRTPKQRRYYRSWGPTRAPGGQSHLGGHISAFGGRLPGLPAPKADSRFPAGFSLSVGIGTGEPLTGASLFAAAHPPPILLKQVRFLHRQDGLQEALGITSGPRCVPRGSP